MPTLAFTEAFPDKALCASRLNKIRKCFCMKGVVNGVNHWEEWAWKDVALQ